MTDQTTEQTQQAYLQAAKEVLGVTWDELANKAGITPRALKTYRMPDTSKDHRTMPNLAKAAIERVLEEHKKIMQKSAQST